MNLVMDRWLPISRRSGVLEQIAPWQLTERMDRDPVDRLHALRPDFDGTLVQFCIGLLQTAMAPADEREWRQLYEQPPEPQQLAQIFRKHERAFELDGEGPRFMQDFDLTDGERKEIGALLLDEPGENTLRNNADHFVKRGNVEAMHPHVAAAALLTLQVNAPSGGAGHRVSIRGGGPMTTVLVPDARQSPDRAALWHLLWLNVLPQEEFEALCGNPQATSPTAIFPWLGPTRTSDENGQPTTPEDGHPLQVYWGMPRRIRLAATEQGVCSLSGQSGPVIRNFFAKNYGVQYLAWRHPLSPYRPDPQGMLLPLHPQPDGLGYRHWLRLSLGAEEDKNGVRPAAVVSWHFSSRRRRAIAVRLWGFGYDMDNMKARGWHETIMPILHLDEQHREAFIDVVRDILDAAEQVSGNLRSALKKAWFKPKAKVGGDCSFIAMSFWQRTEPDFYALLEQIHAAVLQGADGTALRHAWFKVVDEASQTLLATWTESGCMEHEDPKRIALARRDLRKFNRKQAIRDALRLDLPAAGE